MDFETKLLLKQNFEKLASEGVDLAWFNLGLSFEKGTVTEDNRPDYFEAAKYYKLAADKGIVKAQANLGILYISGLVSEDKISDYKEGIKYLKLAAEQGNKKAEFYLSKEQKNIEREDDCELCFVVEESDSEGTLKDKLKKNLTREKISEDFSGTSIDEKIEESVIRNLAQMKYSKIQTKPMNYRRDIVNKANISKTKRVCWEDRVRSTNVKYTEHC